MSGYYGLYHAQTIVYSKYKAEYINRKTKNLSSSVNLLPSFFEMTVASFNKASVLVALNAISLFVIFMTVNV